MYVPNNELTLTEEDVESLAQRICQAGFGPHDFDFQSRANRDAVASRCKQLGARIRKYSIGHQIIDPRYTVEGQLAGLPDKGLANDSIVTNLYGLERTL